MHITKKHLIQRHIILKAILNTIDCQYKSPGITIMFQSACLAVGFEINLKDFDAWKRIEGMLSA